MTSSSRISSILRSAHQLSAGVCVHGATVAAQALIVLREVVESNKSCVVICPNDEVANDWLADAQTLCDTFFESKLLIYYFPGWDQSPYTPVAPSIKTRFARLSVLEGVRHNLAPTVLVTSLSGASIATLPLDILTKYSITLHTEESVDSRDQLIHRLIESGYLRVDTVEDPGTFAARGELIDIFPPNMAQPLRIELYGDLIERIRHFNPETQRTAPSTPNKANIINSALIIPAREVLINLETTARIREKLKAFADDAGVSRSVRDPILTNIQPGVYPDHSDAWGPFAYTTRATIWDHLPVDWSVIWNDLAACHQEFDKFILEQCSLATEAVDSGLIIPPVHSLFLPDETQLEFLKKRKTLLSFERLQVTDADSNSDTDPAVDVATPSQHRVFLKPNNRLVTGSKHSLAELEPTARLWLKEGFKIIILASTQSQLERIRYLLSAHSLSCELGATPKPGAISLHAGSLSGGFCWPTEGLVLLTESEILGTKHVRQAKTKASSKWAGLQVLADLSVGDLVVHVDHGIGRYQGLARLDLLGAPSDFLVLEYANKDKLYLPVYRLNVIQKYIGTTDTVSLDRLGSQRFTKVKERVKDAVKKLAVDLIQLYAKRKIIEGTRHSPRDAEFREFEAKFPFDETPDQLKAIEDTLSDMESGKVMDRLICGDVGYGKTEVAIRAAFRAVSDGKQAVVLVPTTVLAHQHEVSFRSRLKDYAVTIEVISRFKSTQEQRSIIASLAAGKIDIIIGTHRLLSRDIKFNDLGLLIIDEEHRFGVEHKEKLKALKVRAHVMTLTATPIPRTLHMSLSGLRDISLMTTPPLDRLPIRTYISKYDDALIKRAIELELNRGGQVFFVHNRVQTIHDAATKLRELVPQAGVIVAHGQMGDTSLEQAMSAFYEKTSNVLVCSSIIESGLDLPSANTILIDRADTFGLAQLYQIRGRVGRGQNRAYCYLLIPPQGAVTEEAKQRLEVIQRFVELGSGFNIASHDLEIRGGGDLLGPQQSGHIAAVGFDLYTELLEEAIHEIEGQPIAPEESHRDPEIKTPFSSFLGEDYIPDVHHRLSLYRRLSVASVETEILKLEEELKDRFGPMPPEAQNLLWLIRLKLLLKQSGIDSVTIGNERTSFSPGPNSRLDPKLAIKLMSQKPKDYQITPDSKFIARIQATSLQDFYFSCESLVNSLLSE